MFQGKGKQLWVVVGPTAVGKTTMAIALAKALQTEIVSADSRQFYKEMRIGTACPSEDELQAVPHHFIHSHSIAQELNAGDFERECLSCLDGLFERHDKVVLVGGSGLFVKAVCQGLDDLPQVPESLRQSLNHRLEMEGLAVLRSELEDFDPVYCQTADLDNPQRVVRALEVCLHTDRSFSSFQSHQPKERNFDCIPIGLHLPREVLYAQINQRVLAMLAQGLVEEVRNLLPYRHTYALQTVGYKEIFDYLDGYCTLEEATQKIQQNTRNFAKRQITWFKKMPDIEWFAPNAVKDIMDYMQKKYKS